MTASTEAPPDETVIHVLWINAGLSCDGDSVALTAATQPSIEEIALGAFPGLPKIAVHWPLIDFECGPVGGADDFLEWFFKADRGELEPFVLVVEGSIPNEAIKTRGLLVRVREQPRDRPADDDERVARPPRARRRSPCSPPARAPRTAASTRWPVTRPARWASPTTSAGAGNRRPGLPIVCVPGCPTHPDNLSETILYLLYQATGQAPMIPLDDALRPTVAVRRDRPRGLRPRRLLRARRLRDGVRLAEVHREARLLGPGREVQRAQARLDQRRRRLPERRRHLHRLHDAWFPRQVHALHGRTAGLAGVDDGDRGVRQGDPRLRKDDREDARRRTEVARARASPLLTGYKGEWR